MDGKTVKSQKKKICVISGDNFVIKQTEEEKQEGFDFFSFSVEGGKNSFVNILNLISDVFNLGVLIHTSESQRHLLRVAISAEKQNVSQCENQDTQYSLRLQL